MKDAIMCAGLAIAMMLAYVTDGSMLSVFTGITVGAITLWLLMEDGFRILPEDYEEVDESDRKRDRQVSDKTNR